MVNICDVYNLEGEKVIFEKTFTEISEILNVPRRRVLNSFYRGSRICGTFLVVKCKSAEEEELNENYCNRNAKLISEEWENVVKPFRNVEWVKNYSYGTKVLRVKKS